MLNEKLNMLLNREFILNDIIQFIKMKRGFFLGGGGSKYLNKSVFSFTQSVNI